MDKEIDVLKPFEEILEPDSRQKAFVILNRETLQYRERTLKDHYSAIKEIELSTSVPEKIRKHFDTARNLLLYSWFVYRFIPVAEMHAFASVEYALKEKSGKTDLMFKRLLRLAIEEKWIRDSGFKYFRLKGEQPEEQRSIAGDPDQRDVQGYCKVLLDSLPYLRNELAHGSSMLYPGGLTTIAICADLINQLFEPKKKRK